MRESIATTLFKLFDDVVIGKDREQIELHTILTLDQRTDLIYEIIKKLPENDLEQVTRFHDAFKVKREKTNQIEEFEFNKLRISLILEEAMELGFALGYGTDTFYKLILHLFKKVSEKTIEPGIIEVADALCDLRVVVNGSTDVFNLGEYSQELMEEVTRSNMSKLIPDIEGDETLKIIKDSVAKYAEQGIKVRSEKLGNGYVAIINDETNKILKPTTYVEPDLKSIIFNTK